MIKQLQNIKPQISFGLGYTQTTVAAGTPVTVWLDTLYNLDAYVFFLSSPGTIARISDYEYRVTVHSPGTYPITLSVASKTAKISLQSNTITLTVV